MDRIKRICSNCDDYDSGKGVCSIRFTIIKDKTRVPMSRKPKQAGCDGFMYARSLFNK